MDLQTLSEFADNQRKFETTIVFAALLLNEIIFSFWLSNLCGFKYNNLDFNWKNFVNFLSSYQILIPVFSFLAVTIVTRVIYPIILNFIGYSLNKEAWNTEVGFKKLLKDFDLFENNDFKNDWPIIKEQIDITISKEGQSTLLNQSILLFTIFIILIGLTINFSLWSLIPALIILVFLIIHAFGYQTLRIIYIKRAILHKVIEDELNKE
ncbi:MAG: hypothetical protein A2046_00080 [Bacteroidetes bacterium GWA2_30_7]|nr:MAG: hypothetical protein A2046_00080 [Bacteroidetes bacterium GWA2_30_7]